MEGGAEYNKKGDVIRYAQRELLYMEWKKGYTSSLQERQWYKA
jgi:hypothetical protein